MFRKFLTIFITLLFLSSSAAMVGAAPLFQEETSEAGQAYIVQADDWLSKIADKFYGDVRAYPLILEATNLKATVDESYATINDPNLIEVGQKLYIPTEAELVVTTPMTETTTTTETATLSGELVIYSGRSEDLVGPLIAQFQEQHAGLDVQVRYGETAGMAATILEEGANSPTDIYYGQDAGALGALAQAGRLLALPEDITGQIAPRFRSLEGYWVGTSGRARTVVYNTNNLTPADLPDSIFGFCEPEWEGRIGWAPTNGSFQAFVTALRVVEGEDRAREWLTCIQANGVQVYSKNTPIVEAVGNGEIDIGFVNHYYLYRFLAEDPDFSADNYHPRSGGVGAMINVAGIGIVDSTDNQAAAETFVRFLLSEEAQQYFNSETNEYPLIETAEISLNPQLQPLSDITTPNLDLSNLSDLDGTLQLLQEVGVL